MDWFGEIERKYHNKWKPWYLDEGKYAIEINFQCYVRIVNWLSEVWSCFPEAKIAKPFAQCGITSNENDFLVEPEYIVLDNE